MVAYDWTVLSGDILVSGLLMGQTTDGVEDIARAYFLPLTAVWLLIRLEGLCEGEPYLYSLFCTQGPFACLGDFDLDFDLDWLLVKSIDLETAGILLLFLLSNLKYLYTSIVLTDSFVFNWFETTVTSKLGSLFYK